MPQREGKSTQVFSSVLHCFLNFSLQYLWPIGLEIIKNNEKFRKLVTVGEEIWALRLLYLKSGFCINSFNPRNNSPSLHFRAGISKGGLRFKSKLCMGLPRHLICNKRPIPLKWKCGHVEGEQACNLHSLAQTPQEPCLWGCARCLTLETGSILQGRWMVCVASAAQGMLGQHMEGSWQLCVAALEEPGNKGEKYRLKNQNVQK